MSGEFLVASGNAGMVQTPSNDSTQRSVKITYYTMQAKNTSVNIQDSSGKTAF